MRTTVLDVNDPGVQIEVELVGPGPAQDPTTPVGKQDGGGRVSSAVLARAIEVVASRLRHELTAISDPDEMTMEFSASLKGGNAVLISGEGTFKVSLKWVKHTET